MATDELCWTPGAELARMVRTKDVSPVEVVEAFLARIERINPQINAYCTLTAERARAAAREAETAVARANVLGRCMGAVLAQGSDPHHGIRTTMGSKIFEHHVPQEDAVLAARLRDAGGILLGKTNTPEFGCKPFTDNRLFGATANPWSSDRSAGGSSGGAAAAVAAGLVLWQRAATSRARSGTPQPGAGRGVQTFPRPDPALPDPDRVERDVVPRPDRPHGWRRGADVAVMAGPDPRDPLALPATGEDWARLADPPDVRGLRVAWTPDLGGASAVDATIVSICRAAVRVFAGLGCTLVDASPRDRGHPGSVSRPQRHPPAGRGREVPRPVARADGSDSRPAARTRQDTDRRRYRPGRG